MLLIYYTLLSNIVHKHNIYYVKHFLVCITITGIWFSNWSTISTCNNSDYCYVINIYVSLVYKDSKMGRVLGNNLPEWGKILSIL